MVRNSTTETLQLVKARCSDSYPSSIFYAYKQRETEIMGIYLRVGKRCSMLLSDQGFKITGTWPMRTEGRRDSRTSQHSRIIRRLGPAELGQMMCYL